MATDRSLPLYGYTLLTPTEFDPGDEVCIVGAFESDPDGTGKILTKLIAYFPADVQPHEMVIGVGVVTIVDPANQFMPCHIQWRRIGQPRETTITPKEG